MCRSIELPEGHPSEGDFSPFLDADESAPEELGHAHQSTSAGNDCTAHLQHKQILPPTEAPSHRRPMIYKGWKRALTHGQDSPFYLYKRYGYLGLGRIDDTKSYRKRNGNDKKSAKKGNEKSENLKSHKPGAPSTHWLQKKKVNPLKKQRRPVSIETGDAKNHFTSDENHPPKKGANTQTYRVGKDLSSKRYGHLFTSFGKRALFLPLRSSQSLTPLTGNHHKGGRVKRAAAWKPPRVIFGYYPREQVETGQDDMEQISINGPSNYIQENEIEKSEKKRNAVLGASSSTMSKRQKYKHPLKDIWSRVYFGMKPGLWYHTQLVNKVPRWTSRVSDVKREATAPAQSFQDGGNEKSAITKETVKRDVIGQSRDQPGDDDVHKQNTVDLPQFSNIFQENGSNQFENEAGSESSDASSIVSQLQGENPGDLLADSHVPMKTNHEGVIENDALKRILHNDFT